MQGAVARLLDGGDRLHLQHGPIDLIIGAEGDGPGARQQAFAAAAARFGGVLEGLVEELDSHRARLRPDTPQPRDPVAQRMYGAARPFCDAAFVTPMIAVAGSVADAILSAMLSTGPLLRAYVNNGGDIALHLARGAEFSVAMAGHDGRDLGRIRVVGRDGVGGIATSGAGGRSLSRGIADSVTVLADNAALADAAATLIANAVDLPDHPGILRERACDLQPDSDLGERLVVTGVPQLSSGECASALAEGLSTARRFVDAGLIRGAALVLQDLRELTGPAVLGAAKEKEIEHA